MTESKLEENRPSGEAKEAEIDGAWGGDDDVPNANQSGSMGPPAPAAGASGARSIAPAPDAATTSVPVPPGVVATASGTPPVGESPRVSLVQAIPGKWHLLRGAATTAVGGSIAFVIMAAEQQWRWGVPWAIFWLLVASVGVLDFLGTFADPDEAVESRVTIQSLAPTLGALTAAFLATMTFIGLTVAGYMPIALTAVLVPASFLALVAATFATGVALGSWRLDENGQERPLLRRHGFWVVTVATLLYLPLQGSYSLSDPWETHYGEVAREMLSRKDWISTWWAQDGWFWSKPVLDFWVQAIAMSIFGVKFKPGEMLVASQGGHTPWPEWAVRMPVFVLTVIGLYLLYKGVARVFGRRAGLIGAIVLSTMPQWFLLAHQTITDMPLVATLCAAMGLLLLGMHSDPEQKIRAFEVSFGGRRVRFSAYHVVLGVILMSALPQILYLCSRNLEFLWIAGAKGFRLHLDEFWSGSAGNCGLPGNEACAQHTPVYPLLQPWGQGAMWLVLLAVMLFLNRKERRFQRLCFLAAWYFAAVSTLGKGPAGFALPMCATFTYIAATRNWRQLLRLEILSGLIIILVVAIPWYFVMYTRHGQQFTDRLIFHDMFKRAFEHVHDTNEGDDVSFRFYVWQLGYALFLWSGLVPAGLVFWARRRDDAAGGKGDVSVFLAMWFVFAFALFTAMLTKFHHYIFPAVPPAAMLTGVMVDRLIGEGPLARPKALVAYLGGTALAALFTVYGLTRLSAGGIFGYRTDEGVALPAPRYWLAALCISAGVALAVWVYRTFGLPPDDAAEERAAGIAGEGESSYARQHERLMLGAAAVAGAIVVALVGRDLITRADSEIVGSARLVHLLTYNYRRPWPDTLDFGAVITGFVALGVVLCLALSIARWRRHVAVLFTATALIWAVWGIDVYWMKAAPHWGQRELLAKYFETRASPNDPIVAYQMNWKGENFYTGNKIPAFVSSGGPFTTYIKGETAKGNNTMYFVTEWGRMSSLKSEIGTSKSFDALTDKRLDNKFGLFRATF